MRLYRALLTVILCLSAPASSTPVKQSWTIGQTVYTQGGPVSGHAASYARNVSTYLGIPYAKPPIGDLRFAPPQGYFNHTPIDGSKFVCPAPLTFPRMPWAKNYALGPLMPPSQRFRRLNTPKYKWQESH